ncbi:MAG: hypothetical protein ABIQ15_03870 [Nocardioides sp.]
MTAAPAPALTPARLPRRVALPRTALESLAARTGTTLPWRAAATSSRLARALGDLPDAPTDPRGPHDPGALEARGLVDAAGVPLAEVAAALEVLGRPEVAVRVDLGVRRAAAPQGSSRLVAWHHLRAGRVTALVTVGAPEVELAWFADEHWPRELAHLVTVPTRPDAPVTSPVPTAVPASVPPHALTLPFELLVAAGAALRERRPEVLAELLARHRVVGPDGAELDRAAAAEQVGLLHTAGQGRVQVTVAGTAGDGHRRLGVVTWVLFADGWRSLVPATVDGVPVVRLATATPPMLGVAVARLVAGVGA